MWVVKYRKIFYTFSGILVIASVASLAVWGLLPGIDFTGGTLIEVSYTGSAPALSAVAPAITSIDPGASIRASRSSDGKDEYIVRMKDIRDTEKESVLGALGAGSSTPGISGTLNAYDSIGPILGEEALRKAIWSIVLVILAIVIFITIAFSRVSLPVSSWKYGLVAIIALVHDVIIPTGVFSVLGHFAGYEVDTLFVTAILVVLGFSVHDTIVVFDRVRENLRNSGGKETFEETVGKSVSQTFVRSINTSLTTLFALIILYILGGSITQHFTLALIIGIAAGTYSSIFVGSPLLVTLEKLQRKK